MTMGCCAEEEPVTANNALATRMSAVRRFIRTSFGWLGRAPRFRRCRRTGIRGSVPVARPPPVDAHQSLFATFGAPHYPAPGSIRVGLERQVDANARDHREEVAAEDERQGFALPGGHSRILQQAFQHA